ncbi:MAG: TrkA C-terminal domain-containing protein, partial [Candidatus Aminicenantes bacterium]|nr:TrkA C-terminal domain-containing protein [Candidatus Aminicenantes bacterium]
EIIEGLYLLEIEVPNIFVGKKIKDLDLRKKYGVDVILIKEAKEKGEKLLKRIPGADYRFRAEDNLLILGERKAVQTMRNM